MRSWEQTGCSPVTWFSGKGGTRVFSVIVKLLQFHLSCSAVSPPLSKHHASISFSASASPSFICICFPHHFPAHCLHPYSSSSSSPSSASFFMNSLFVFFFFWCAGCVWEFVSSCTLSCAAGWIKCSWRSRQSTCFHGLFHTAQGAENGNVCTWKRQYSCGIANILFMIIWVWMSTIHDYSVWQVL